MPEDSSFRVLVVDDDPDLAALTVTFLERELGDATVEYVTSPGDGIDALATGGFDCVVSDYDMPAMNGLEFIDAAKRGADDLPGILFTARDTEDLATNQNSCDADHYQQKQPGSAQYADLAQNITRTIDTSTDSGHDETNPDSSRKPLSNSR